MAARHEANARRTKEPSGSARAQLVLAARAADDNRRYESRDDVCTSFASTADKPVASKTIDAPPIPHLLLQFTLCVSDIVVQNVKNLRNFGSQPESNGAISPTSLFHLGLLLTVPLTGGEALTSEIYAQLARKLKRRGSILKNPPHFRVLCHLRQLFRF